MQGDAAHCPRGLERGAGLPLPEDQQQQRQQKLQQAPTMPASCSTALTAAAWAMKLGVPVLPAAYLLVHRYGSSPLYACVGIMNWGICICLLRLRPSSPSRRTAHNVLGTWTWAARLATVVHQAFLVKDHTRAQPLFLNGVVYVMLIFAMLCQWAATQHMARWPRRVFAFLYACVMGRLAVMVTAMAVARAGLLWWHQLGLYALVQLCVFGPALFLTQARAWQDRAMPAAIESGSNRGSSNSKPARAAAAVPSGHQKAQDTCSKPGSDLVSQASAAATSWSSHISSVPVRCSPHHPPRCVSHTSPAAVLQAVRSAPYSSKLGPQHKVCLKLDTQVPCTALPPDMAQQIQQALRSIVGPSSLRVSELAVRPGCIMITMTLSRTTHAAAGDISSSTPASAVTGQLPAVGADDASPASADEALAATIGQALLQRLCCPTNAATSSSSSSSASGGLIACQRAVLQVDAQLLAATWQEEAWDLRALLTLPGPGGSPDSSSCDSMASKGSAAVTAEPWLGMVTACKQVAPAAAAPAAGMSSTAAECKGNTTPNTDVSLSVEVQLWGLGKLDVVEGWAPPPDGEHTWTPPGYAVTAAAAGEGGSAAAGRELRLLARSAAGAYLLTTVQQVKRSAAHADAASMQVVVCLPAAQQVWHHPGGPPSPLLLLALELWDGEVLRSATPLLAATMQQQQQQGVAAGMHAWWWGASDAAVAAALGDLQLCAQALSAGGEAAAEALPSHLAFVTDLGHWLAGVRRCGLSSQQLCAMAAGVHSPGLHAAPGLPPAELQQLGQDLVAHAAHIGLAGVQDMLCQQMRRVVQPALKQRGQQRPAWLQGMRDVVAGYHCHMCEAAYKQHMCTRLSSVQVASSTGTVLYVLTASCCTLAMGDGWLQMVILPVPWVLLHVVGAWLRLFKPSTPARDALRWPCVAYVWRVTGRLLMEVGLLPKLSISAWFCRRVRTWPLTHMVWAATEQMQASAVLPARWMVAVTGLIDMPTIIICTWLNNTWDKFLMVALLAPAVMVGSRLAIEARYRAAWLRSATRPASRPVAVLAPAKHALVSKAVPAVSAVPGSSRLHAKLE